VTATDFEFVFSHFHVSEGIGDREAFCLALKAAVCLVLLVPLYSSDTGKGNKRDFRNKGRAAQK